MTNYAKEKKLAQSGKLKDRLALAKDPKTTPEILYFLSEDIDDLVRQAVANNEGAPRHADVILTKDNNTDIRSDLAVKLARITPHLPSDKRVKLYKLTEEALSVLARDQVLRVREILAEALAEVANAPASVISILANDNELSVAEPVLICSPVLSEKDLLQIISSDPIQGALAAISQREELSANVANIIIKNGDSDAVTYLLKNHKATIAEKDLDKVVDQAPTVEDWHEPLVKRPLLSSRSICRLASFVAMNLLDKLQSRVDMDDETLVAVAQSVETRLAIESKEDADKFGIIEEEEDEQSALEEAKRLKNAGALTSELIEEALSDSRRIFVMASVAVLAGYDSLYVADKLTHKSPRKIVSLAWKAGLSAHLALQFQTQLAQLPPKSIIGPNKETGGFFLSNAEMEKELKSAPKAKY